jgi:hypothetical protein
MLDYKKIKSEFTKKLAEFNETKLLSWVKFDKTKQEYKYIGECTGNNGNGCFLNSPGHNCGCFTKITKEEPKQLSPMNDLLQDLKNAKISSKDSVDIINDEFIRGTINKYVQTTLDSVIKRIETELLDGESKWCQEQTLKEKLVIELNEYDYTGSSNDIYGMVVKVNGVEMPYHNLDVSTILEEVLEHLGYEVEIIETLDR